MLHQSNCFAKTQATFDLCMFDRPQNGTVSAEIRANQDGRVEYDATTWPAKLYLAKSHQDTFPVGEKVRVIGREGITLLVISQHQVWEQTPQPHCLSDLISHWLREQFSLCS